jgi:hypothetical protein
MKLIDLYIDKNMLAANQGELSDTIKVLLVKKDESFFERLDFDNNDIFLEPMLFFYFFKEEKQKKYELDQILYGYHTIDKRKNNIIVNSDEFGIINLPPLGFIQSNKANHSFILKSTNGAYYITGTEKIETEVQIMPNEFIADTTIKLCPFVPEILINHLSAEFVEPIQCSTDSYKHKINIAAKIIKENTPAFWELLNLTSKEACIYNSYNQYSFASMAYQGTAFINIDGKNRSTVFFIDDLSHQCGHVLFYILTLNPSYFLKVDRSTPLNKFSGIGSESRNVYGTFHGLFTYTTILYSLSICIDKKIFQKEERHELIGRFGFYMEKFRKDLFYMNRNEIVTEKGADFVKQFLSGYKKIFEKYQDLLMGLDYTNQPYLFDYDKFNEFNPIKAYV